MAISAKQTMIILNLCQTTKCPTDATEESVENGVIIVNFEHITSSSVSIVNKQLSVMILAYVITL